MAEQKRKKAARNGRAKKREPEVAEGKRPTRRRKGETEAAYKRRIARERKAAEVAERQRAIEADPAGAAEDEANTGAAKTVETGALYLAVYRNWTRGLTWDALSAKHGLGVRRCQQIVEELKGRRIKALGLANPLYGSQLARELILRHSASISEYAELADAVPQGQWAVKLGALKKRDEALVAFKDLMQELGYLPKNLGTLGVQEDFIGLMETLLDKMEELDLPIDVQRQLVESVELRVVQHREGRLALAAGDPTGTEQVLDAEVVPDAA